jgi:hypothetical protein
MIPKREKYTKRVSFVGLMIMTSVCVLIVLKVSIYPEEDITAGFAEELCVITARNFLSLFLRVWLLIDFYFITLFI